MHKICPPKKTCCLKAALFELSTLSNVEQQWNLQIAEYGTFQLSTPETVNCLSSTSTPASTTPPGTEGKVLGGGSLERQLILW